MEQVLDTLVYNTGVVPSGGIEDLDLEVWRDVMRINVDDAFTSARAAWPHLQGWRRRDSHEGLRCRLIYLASDEAAWVTGVVLPVDGGLTTGSIW
ncbi:MAG TPA: SDR family NAD(P)-dependent oxidoreductase [Pseudonocardiaceae bacterium]|nr:SDR family NAD(P)-dependent oxidoreductase [Pseudonocardiaceae bacterium]